MNSQVYSYCIFHNTCIHTDSYIVGKTDIKSKIGKEERKKKKKTPNEITGYWIQ